MSKGGQGLCLAFCVVFTMAGCSLMPVSRAGAEKIAQKEVDLLRSQVQELQANVAAVEMSTAEAKANLKASSEALAAYIQAQKVAAEQALERLEQ